MYPYFEEEINEVKTNDLDDKLEDKFDLDDKLEDKFDLDDKLEDKFDLDDKLEDKFDLDDKLENQILELLLKAISQENKDNKYFAKLENLFKNPKDKEALRKIKLDDKKHFKIFSDIYKSLTKKMPIFKDEEIDIDDYLPDEIEDAIEQKLDNVELYRLLLSSFLDVGVRDLIYEVITDEQGHAQKLNQIQNRMK